MDINVVTGHFLDLKPNTCMYKYLLKVFKNVSLIMM